MKPQHNCLPVASLPHEDGLGAGLLLLQPQRQPSQRVCYSLVSVLQHAQQQAHADGAGGVGVWAALRIHGPAAEFQYHLSLQNFLGGLPARLGVFWSLLSWCLLCRHDVG